MFAWLLTTGWLFAGPTAPQESPPTQSPALDNLLKRLEEQDQGLELPPLPTGESLSVAEALFEHSGGVDPIPSGPAEIHVHRVRDIVESFIDGERSVMQYWDAERSAQDGDEFHVSSKGKVLVDFPDGAHLNLDGPAILRLDTGPEGQAHAFTLERLDRVFLYRGSASAATIRFPGGYQMVAGDSLVSVRLQELRAYEVRNSGPSPMTLTGPYLREELALEPGEHVFLPAFDILGRGPALPAQEVSARDNPDLTALVPDDVNVNIFEESLELRGESSQTRVVRVSGARLRLPPGSRVDLRRAKVGPVHPRPQER